MTRHGAALTAISQFTAQVSPLFLGKKGYMVNEVVLSASVAVILTQRYHATVRGMKNQQNTICD